MNRAGARRAGSSRDPGGQGGQRPFRRFTRGAAVLFLLVVLHTVGQKLPSGELHRDWMHSLLHLISGMLAMAASVHAGALRAARLFTIGVLAVYGPLAITGWFIDGLALRTPVRIPLQPADNVFHLLLAGAALATIWSAHRARRRPPVTGAPPASAREPSR